MKKLDLIFYENYNFMKIQGLTFSGEFRGYETKDFEGKKTIYAYFEQTPGSSVPIKVKSVDEFQKGETYEVKFDLSSGDFKGRSYVSLTAV